MEARDIEIPLAVIIRTAVFSIFWVSQICTTYYHTNMFSVQFILSLVRFGEVYFAVEGLRFYIYEKS